MSVLILSNSKILSVKKLFIFFSLIILLLNLVGLSQSQRIVKICSDDYKINTYVLRCDVNQGVKVLSVLEVFSKQNEFPECENDGFKYNYSQPIVAYCNGKQQCEINSIFIEQQKLFTAEIYNLNDKSLYNIPFRIDITFTCLSITQTSTPTTTTTTLNDLIQPTLSFRQTNIQSTGTTLRTESSTKINSSLFYSASTPTTSTTAPYATTSTSLINTTAFNYLLFNSSSSPSFSSSTRFITSVNNSTFITTTTIETTKLATSSSKTTTMSTSNSNKPLNNTQIKRLNLIKNHISRINTLNKNNTHLINNSNRIINLTMGNLTRKIVHDEDEKNNLGAFLLRKTSTTTNISTTTTNYLTDILINNNDNKSNKSSALHKFLNAYANFNKNKKTNLTKLLEFYLLNQNNLTHFLNHKNESLKSDFFIESTTIKTKTTTENLTRLDFLTNSLFNTTILAASILTTNTTSETILNSTNLIKEEKENGANNYTNSAASFAAANLNSSTAALQTTPGFILLLDANTQTRKEKFQLENYDNFSQVKLEKKISLIDFNKQISMSQTYPTTTTKSNYNGNADTDRTVMIILIVLGVVFFLIILAIILLIFLRRINQKKLDREYGLRSDKQSANSIQFATTQITTIESNNIPVQDAAVFDSNPTYNANLNETFGTYKARSNSGYDNSDNSLTGLSPSRYTRTEPDEYWRTNI